MDKNIQRKIIGALELKPADIVLEIGAGQGELTRPIAEKVNRVYALEIDDSLCKILKENLKDYPNTEIIYQDILKFSPKKYFKKKKLKIVGNIPYYISSPIIAHLLEFKDKIEVIFVTVQREFAKRVVAPPGAKDYGAFSCFIQYHTQAKVIFNIPNTCFFPAPKVDSCLLKLSIRPHPAVQAKDEVLFFKVIRAAFNKRRKTLRNSLAGYLPAQKLEQFFSKYNLNRNIRPERLTLQDFTNLVNL